MKKYEMKCRQRIETKRYPVDQAGWIDTVRVGGLSGEARLEQSRGGWWLLHEVRRAAE